MRTFYLVRHALKEKDIGDVAITAEGRLQAEATARLLMDKPIDAVVTSPLRRAKETAGFIAAALKSDVIEDHRLRERANWGDLPGQTFEEFVTMWEQCTRDPDCVPPVGDSARQAGRRFAAALSEIGDAAPHGSTVVIVTHGGVLTDFLVHYFDEVELNRWHPDFVAMQSSLISECSVTQIVYDGGRFQMESFASVAHLRHC
jgi:2,3-bisphosphoglycerate-dependent phosphoglycerate mutase